MATTSINNTTPVPIQFNANGDQPIKLEVTIKKEKSDDYLPGYSGYLAVQGILHLGIVARTVSGCVSECTPVYQSTYAAGAVAGAAFGLYKAMYGNPVKNIDKQATAFAESDGLTTKAMMIAESYITTSTLLQFAESKELVENVTAGNLVAGYWGFMLGAELAGMAYEKIVGTSKE